MKTALEPATSRGVPPPWALRRAAFRTPARGTAAVAANALGCALCVAMPGANAQSIDRVDQSFWVRGAVFEAYIDSKVRLDYVGAPQYGVQGVGTTVDFENTLGLPRSQARGDLLLGLRLFDRGRVELEHYSLDRSGNRQLVDNSIVVNGITYNAQAQLQTTFGSQVTRLGLGYSLLKSATAEAGLMLGIQYTRYRLALTGEGSVDHQPPAPSTVVQSDSGPLPTIGAYGSLALAPGWSMDLRGDYLPVDSKTLLGNLGAAELNVYRRLAPNVTFGLGVRHVQYKVDRKTAGEVTGRFDFSFTGPQVMLEAGF